MFSLQLTDPLEVFFRIVFSLSEGGSCGLVKLLSFPNTESL